MWQGQRMLGLDISRRWEVGRELELSVDFPAKGLWGHTGVETAEGMFDKRRMTSGIFHAPAHCTCRQVRELSHSGLERS